MKTFYISIFIGTAAGLIDILPMIAQRLEKKTIISAFIHYFVVSLLIVNIDLPGIVWWFQGPMISFILAVPVMIIVSKNDKKAVPIIFAMSLILGTLIGIAGHYLT